MRFSAQTYPTAIFLFVLPILLMGLLAQMCYGGETGVGHMGGLTSVQEITGVGAPPPTPAWCLPFLFSDGCVNQFNLLAEVRG